MDFESLTDEELVPHILTNRDSFRYIVERYQDKLYRFIRRISGRSDEEIEDILQEVFIKMYQNLNNFDTDLKFSSWAYRIARNHTISHHRKKSNQTLLLEAEMAAKLVSGLDVHGEVMNQLEAEEVNEIIAKLKPNYRDILVLKFLEEKDYREISDILKIPEGTVGTRIHRAKHVFKKVYEKRHNR